MPFNKGDFTQQGVAGHVNSILRLNEKRLVYIDLTSNEEAEGCTITGTVKDLLNDKVYGIGAGVSGNIEITENGENINVAPYATATVNVAGGGGDNVHYCTVTFKAPNSGHLASTLPSIYISSNALHLYNAGAEVVNNDDVWDIPYNKATFMGQDSYMVMLNFKPDATVTASDAVNCEFDADYLELLPTDETENSSITLTVSDWGTGGE